MLFVEINVFYIIIPFISTFLIQSKHAFGHAYRHPNPQTTAAAAPVTHGAHQQAAGGINAAVIGQHSA